MPIFLLFSPIIISNYRLIPAKRLRLGEEKKSETRVFDAPKTRLSPSNHSHHFSLSQAFCWRMFGLSYSPGAFTRRLLLFEIPRRESFAVVCAAKGPRPRYPRVWKTNKKIGTISKAVKLVDCIKGLSNVKEEVYGALDSFIAWELEFPLITVKKALKTLERQREWKRIIQVTKWMLSKGQGRTMGSYYVLLNALAEDGRFDEVEELWKKLFSENLESTPRMFYDKMISIYYRRGMHDQMFEVFADMEELGIRPTPSIVEMVGEIFRKLDMIDKYKKLKQKYPPPKWEYRYIKGKRVKIKASQLRERGDASDGLRKLEGGTNKEPNGSSEHAELASDELENEINPSDDSDLGSDELENDINPSDDSDLGSDELGEAANSCPQTTI